MSGKKFVLLFFGFGEQNYPYTRIMNETLNCCLDKGHEVGVFFIKSSDKYDHIDKRIDITQCPNIINHKAAAYIVYSLCSFLYILKSFWNNKNTVFIVPTTPPFILPFTVVIAKWLTFGRLRWVYHVQDIHPEISFVGKSKTLFFRLLRKLDSKFIRNSNKTVTLSHDMKMALLERHDISNKHIEVANNFVPTFEKSTSNNYQTLAMDKKKGRIIYIFSGNIGTFQRVLEVARYFLDLKEFNDVLYILGDGKEKNELAALLDSHENSKRIRLLSKMPYQEANDFVSQCDFGIVSLVPEITKYAYPSKFGTYLSMGLKVLAFIDKNSELGKVISENNLGYVINNLNDFKNIISTNSVITEEERNRIKGISETLFGRDYLITKNIGIIEGVV